MEKRGQRKPTGFHDQPIAGKYIFALCTDLWAQAYRAKKARGDVIEVRYADDFIIGFQYKWEANEFLHRLKSRLKTFKLNLHPEKTKLIRFGRFAIQQCAAKKLGKPETFEFLGFRHICSKTKKGKYAIKRLTIKARMRKALGAIRMN